MAGMTCGNCGAGINPKKSRCPKCRLELQPLAQGQSNASSHGATYDPHALPSDVVAATIAQRHAEESRRAAASRQKDRPETPKGLATFPPSPRSRLDARPTRVFNRGGTLLLLAVIAVATALVIGPRGNDASTTLLEPARVSEATDEKRPARVVPSGFWGCPPGYLPHRKEDGKCVVPARAARFADRTWWGNCPDGYIDHPYRPNKCRLAHYVQTSSTQPDTPSAPAQQERDLAAELHEANSRAAEQQARMDGWEREEKLRRLERRQNELELELRRAE